MCPLYVDRMTETNSSMSSFTNVEFLGSKSQVGSRSVIVRNMRPVVGKMTEKMFPRFWLSKVFVLTKPTTSGLSGAD